MTFPKVIRKVLGMVSMLALAACASQDPARDAWGYAIPPECRRDLSALNIPVVFVDPETLGRRGGGRLIELYAPGPPPLILIDNTLPEWRKKEARAHAECHGLVGAFHK